MLDDLAGIDHGFMTGCTCTRRSRTCRTARVATRAAPAPSATSSGAAKAIGLVLPALVGKLSGDSIRVPVPVGSIVSLSTTVARDVTRGHVLAVYRAAAEGPLAEILEFSDDRLVSSDITGNPASSIFNSALTRVDGRHVKVAAWYDKKQLERAAGDELTVTRVDARGEALSLLKARDVFGAVVISDAALAGPEVLVAGANGTTVTQVMTAVAGQIQVALTKQPAQGVPLAQVPSVPVADGVPFASTDPRGAGLGSLALPLVIGGVIGGAAFTLFVAGVWRRLVGVTAYALASGIMVVAIAQDWFGILQGNPIAKGIAIGSSTLAIGGLVVGVTALLGPRGVALGAALALLIGNPMSGSTQPRQFLPDPWGAVGQWFAPGASATLLRDLSYFPDAATIFPWLVLSGWVALGVVLVAAGHFRSRAILVPRGSLEGHEPEAAHRDPHDARQPV